MLLQCQCTLPCLHFNHGPKLNYFLYVTLTIKLQDTLQTYEVFYDWRNCFCLVKCFSYWSRRSCIDEVVESWARSRSCSTHQQLFNVITPVLFFLPSNNIATISIEGTNDQENVLPVIIIAGMAMIIMLSTVYEIANKTVNMI